MTDQVQQTVPQQMPLFEEVQAPPAACTFAQCAQGHKWHPLTRQNGCPGCKTAVTGFRMENCPVCNEPASKLTFRVDIVPATIPLTGKCKGDAILGMSADISLDIDQTLFQNPAYQKEVPSKV